MPEAAGERHFDEEWGKLTTQVGFMADQLTQIISKLDSALTRIAVLESTTYREKLETLEKEVAKLKEREASQYAKNQAVKDAAKNLPQWLAYFVAAVMTVIALKDRLDIW